MSENPNGNNRRDERTNLKRKISQGDYNYVENLYRNKPFSPPHSQQNIISQENYKNKNGNNAQQYMNLGNENIPEENPQINKIENMQIPSQNIQLSSKKMNSGKKQELSNPNVNQNGEIFTGMYFANKINMQNQHPNSGNSNIKQLKNIDNNDENEFVKSQQNLQKNENKLISNNMQNPISNKYGYINKNQKNVGMNNNLINNNNININNVNNIQSNNNIQNKMLNNNQLNDFNNNIIMQNNFVNNNNGNNISNNNNSPGDNKNINMNMNMNIPCTSDTIKNQLNDFSIFNKNNISDTIKSNDNQNAQTNQVSGQSFTNQGNENSQQLISNNQNNNMENPYSKNNFDNKMNDNANTIKNENSNQNNNMENPYSKITLSIKMDDNANIMKNQNINMNGQNPNQNNNINFMNSEGNSSPNNILMNNNNLNNNNLMNNQYINTMKNKNNNNTIKNQSNSNKNLMNNQHNSDFNMNNQNNNNFMNNQNNQDQNNFMINQNNNQDQNNFMNNQNNQNQNNFINIQNKQNQNNFMNNQNNDINNNNFMNNQNQNNFINNQNNNNLVPKESQKYSFSRYKKASRVGLELLGDTSYLNSVLQFLGSIRNIASYFLNPKNEEIINKDIKHKQLSFVIYRLFTHLYPFPETDKIKNYKPGTLLKLLGQINNVYKTTNRRNPNELITFILNRLNNELIVKSPDTNQMLCPKNISDKAHVINIGCFNFQKFNNSIISNNLNWFEIKEIKCTQCGNNMYYFQTYNTFELDISFSFNYIKKPIRIYDCFKVYGFPVNPNQFCFFCKRVTQVLRTRNIYSSSNIFIFSLDRKNLDPKYLKIPFIIDEKIEITNFIEMKETPQHYQLTGIVSYYIKGNKYVSFCMNPVDKQWYLYNDENVQQTDISQVIDLHNNKKEFIPCLLAYKTVKV